MKITIDLEKLNDCVAEADKIMIGPEGEKVLLKLLELEVQIAQAIQDANAKLETAALAKNPDFKSIQADKIKVYYRTYIPRFYIDEANVGMVPKELYTTQSKVTYSLDTKAIEKFIDEKKALPAGIVEVKVRPKKMKFSLKKNAPTD